MNIGQVIKELRTNKGMLQAELAKKMDMSEKHISQIETGKVAGTIPSVQKILGHLDAELIVRGKVTVEKDFTL